LATALNEIARQSGVSIEVDETAIPVRESVGAACELLGLDPLYAANEGKMIVVVEETQAELALQSLRSHPMGLQAAIVGYVRQADKPKVLLRTALGTHRVLDRHVGEQLPRIC
ncbi:MAG: hydrogenase expression/formation protein HypE, partial [Armatimonadetes bacterium]|nr:hydrogenase expression/formation protein HypE [Armatimonadota bacterium]